MKPSTNPTNLTCHNTGVFPSEQARRKPRFLTLLSLILVGALVSVHAQTDDFDDGNDDGWTRFDPLGGLGFPAATFSFPNGGYRLEAPAPPVDAAGPARAFSYRTDMSYTDFFAAVDVVDWNDSVDQAFGLLARGQNIGLGQTTAYVCNYNPNQTGSRPGGQFQINRATGEAEDGTLATANVTLIPGHAYRFVFLGAGTVLTGQLYDHLDLTAPIATISVDGIEDDRALTYPEGVIGVFIFSRDDPTGQNSIADATFDNFFAAASAPPGVNAPAIPHPIPGTPQVVDRVPESLAAFHPAGEGITFTATTLGGNAVPADGVQLVLDGADVSAALTTSPAGDDLQAGYDELEANRAYQARIIVTDAGGTSSTNEFVFDTFTQEFLESASAKVIECEDYNYGNGTCDPVNPIEPTAGGLYQNDPPPSAFINGMRVPEDGSGYLDQFGLRGVDYSDASATALSGTLNAYRLCDAVGTTPGVLEIEPGQFVNDVPRDKYRDTGFGELPDHQVFRTEGGEWLNYTRDFPAGDYQVYLRAASTAPQDVLLDQVSGDPTSTAQTTSSLGVFHVPNTHLRTRYQHIPLVDATGAPQTVRLDGENTVRLTIAGEPGTFEIQWTMTMNYLLFAPAAPAPIVVTLLDPAILGSNFEFSFNSEAGVNYRVETTPTLTNPEWTTAQTIPGDGALKSFSTGLKGGGEFFRVVAE